MALDAKMQQCQFWQLQLIYHKTSPTTTVPTKETKLPNDGDYTYLKEKVTFTKNVWGKIKHKKKSEIQEV